MSEFEHIVDSSRLPSAAVMLEASAEQRAALARRFGLVSIGSLTAQINLTHQDRAVQAAGRLMAEVVQSCAVSGDDLPVTIAEPLMLKFVPPSPALPTEHELDADELDEIPMDNGRFDLGEAVAQTLALAIDPYLEGPGANEARRKAGLLGEGEAGPLAQALKRLLDKQ